MSTPSDIMSSLPMLALIRSSRLTLDASPPPLCRRDFDFDPPPWRLMFWKSLQGTDTPVTLGCPAREH